MKTVLFAILRSKPIALSETWVVILSDSPAKDAPSGRGFMEEQSSVLPQDLQESGAASLFNKGTIDGVYCMIFTSLFFTLIP